MMYIINTLLEASAAFLHAPLIFGASFILYFAYKGFNSPYEYSALVTYHENRYSKLASSFAKYQDSKQLILDEERAMFKRLTDAFKKSEALAKELRSQTLLKVESKGPFPEWSVMTYDDCYAAIEVSKMDLNIVIQGGRYEDDRWIITLLDADDVNSRHLDFQCMLEETESILNDVRGGRRVHLEEAIKERDEAIKERDNALLLHKAALDSLLEVTGERDEVLETLLKSEDLYAELEKDTKRLQEKVAHLKEQTTLEDVKEDWEHWEMRIRDAISDALQDGDFVERVMDDLHSECLEYLTND